MKQLGQNNKMFKIIYFETDQYFKNYVVVIFLFIHIRLKCNKIYFHYNNIIRVPKTKMSSKFELRFCVLYNKIMHTLKK